MQEQGNEDSGRYEEKLRRAQNANKLAKRERRLEGERARSSSGETSDGNCRKHKRQKSRPSIRGREHQGQTNSKK